MKKNIFDVIAPILLVIALIIICFFWGCKLDLYMTIAAVVIIGIFAVIAHKKNKRIRELTEKLQNK